MKNFIENKDTRKMQEVLNLKELRSGRFEIEISVGAMSDFKNRKRNKISEDVFISLKKELNNLHLILNNFSKKEVKKSEQYFKDLLDISEIKILNWQEIVRSVNSTEKPNTSYLRWSLYSETRKPDIELIDKYFSFFEQLRFELKLLSSKVKI